MKRKRRRYGIIFVEREVDMFKRLSHWLDIHSVEITCSVVLSAVAFSTVMVGYILYISIINH